MVYKSLMWKYLERFSSLGITLVLSMFLSRLLSTDDYGTIALINVFVAFATTLVQSGLNTALIQKKQVDDVDWSTGLFTNLALSIVLYIILFFAAPYIEAFYEIENLTNVVRVLALSIILGGYNAIQVAYASRMMQFKMMSICTMISSALSGIIGIILAYNGYGVWSLVWQQNTSFLFLCISMMIGTKWKVVFKFSTEKLKAIFSYGWKLTASSMIDTAYAEVFSLVIGKRYSPSMLAYYNKGQTYPKMIGQLVSTSIGSVVLPLYSKAQNDIDRLKEMVRKSIKLSSYVFFPLMFGLAAVAEPFIVVLFSEKWIASAPYVMVFCFAFIFYPINMANTQALNGIGRNDIFLRLNIIKKVISIAVLIISCRYGVMAIAVGYALTAPLNLIINVTPCKKYLNYSFREQIVDFLPSFLISMIMFVCVYVINYLSIAYIVKLILQVALGGIIYILISIIFRIKEFKALLNIIKELFSK